MLRTSAVGRVCIFTLVLNVIVPSYALVLGNLIEKLYKREKAQPNGGICGHNTDCVSSCCIFTVGTTSGKCVGKAERLQICGYVSQHEQITTQDETPPVYQICTTCESRCCCAQSCCPTIYCTSVLDINSRVCTSCNTGCCCNDTCCPNAYCTNPNSKALVSLRPDFLKGKPCNKCGSGCCCAGTCCLSSFCEGSIVGRPCGECLSCCCGFMCCAQTFCEQRLQQGQAAGFLPFYPTPMAQHNLWAPYDQYPGPGPMDQRQAGEINDRPPTAQANMSPYVSAGPDGMQYPVQLVGQTDPVSLMHSAQWQQMGPEYFGAAIGFTTVGYPSLQCTTGCFCEFGCCNGIYCKNSGGSILLN